MSSVAFYPATPKVTLMNREAFLAAFCAFLLVGAWSAQAQEPPPPPPEFPKEGPGKPGREGGEKDGRHPGTRGGSGMSGGYQRGGMPGDMFKELPEAERQRVRAAFEEAWNEPEVVSARERLGKANDEYRAALHAALEKKDPEVVRILEKSRPPMPFGGPPMLARMPDTSEADFPRKAVIRLGIELQMWARSWHLDFPTSGLHDRILQIPAVRDAIKRMQDVPVEQRGDAWKQLRDAYMGAAKMELAKGRDNRHKDGDRGAHGASPPPPPGDNGTRPVRPEGQVR